MHRPNKYYFKIDQSYATSRQYINLLKVFYKNITNCFQANFD